MGERQHGALERFGYNLYMKMLKEEIEKIKGQYVSQDNFEDIELRVDYPAFIPDEYIEKSQKIKVYRDLVEIDNLENLKAYKDEIQDIYGKMPPEAVGLFEYIALKFKARDAGIKTAIVTDDGKSEIRFDREKVEIEVVFKMLQDGVITYLNRDELIIYKGSIEEFLEQYDQYKRRVEYERI